MKLLILNGPNLNLLGRREPGIYGSGTYRDLCTLLTAEAARLGLEIEIFQTNHEGVLVDRIQAAAGIFDGIIINPAAYTHTSIALLDAVRAVSIPAVEVHLSDVSQREDFRQVSYIRAGCVNTIMGRGFQGYVDAMVWLKGFLSQ